MEKENQKYFEVWNWDFFDDVYAGGHAALVINSEIIHYFPDKDKNVILNKDRAEEKNNPVYGGWRGKIARRSLREEANCYYNNWITTSKTIKQPFVYSFRFKITSDIQKDIIHYLEEIQGNEPEYTRDAREYSNNCIRFIVELLNSVNFFDGFDGISEHEFKNSNFLIDSMYLYKILKRVKFDLSSNICPSSFVLFLNKNLKKRSGEYSRITLNLSGWNSDNKNFKGV